MPTEPSRILAAHTQTLRRVGKVCDSILTWWQYISEVPCVIWMVTRIKQNKPKEPIALCKPSCGLQISWNFQPVQAYLDKFKPSEDYYISWPTNSPSYLVTYKVTWLVTSLKPKISFSKRLGMTKWHVATPRWISLSEKYCILLALHAWKTRVHKHVTKTMWWLCSDAKLRASSHIQRSYNSVDNLICLQSPIKIWPAKFTLPVHSFKLKKQLTETNDSPFGSGTVNDSWESSM